MVEAIKRPIVIIWHNGEYYTWRDREDVDELTPTMKIFLMGMLREDPATRYCAREVNTSAQWLAGYGERGYPKGYVRTFFAEHGVSADCFPSKVT